MNSSGSCKEQDVELAAATQERSDKLLLTKQQQQQKKKRKGNRVVNYWSVEHTIPLYVAEYETHSTFPNGLWQHDTKANP